MRNVEIAMVVEWRLVGLDGSNVKAKTGTGGEMTAMGVPRNHIYSNI